MRTNARALAFLAITAVPICVPALTSRSDSAENLLRVADSKLRDLSTLRAEYVEVDAYPGKYRDVRQTARVQLARPNLVRIEIVRARRIKADDPWADSGNNTLNVSDGVHRFAVFFHPESTQVRQAPAGPAPDLKEAPLLAGFFSGASSPAAEIARAKEEGTLDAIDTISPTTVHYRIGGVDKTVEIDGSGLIQHLTVHRPKSGLTQDFTLAKVEFNPSIDAGSFHYEPPREALPFKAAAERKGLEIGADAPDFAVTDAAGRPLELSKLKGKVVVLKFWATWCWPCNQSMAHTNEVAKALDKDVVVVAIAINDSKRGFDAWVRKHPQYGAINFVFDDPNHPGPSSLYPVPSTPTEYVIDKQGKVAAVFSGFTGPTGELEAAIAKAR